MTERYELARDGEALLCFDGAMLARVDSHAPYKRSWTELALYQTVGGKWVVATVARVKDGATFNGKPGVDWYSARAYDTVEKLLAGIKDKRRGGFSGLALALLNTAAEKSPIIEQALEYIENESEDIA